jgi:hypothetical protein
MEALKRIRKKKSGMGGRTTLTTGVQPLMGTTIQ